MIYKTPEKEEVNGYLATRQLVAFPPISPLVSCILPVAKLKPIDRSHNLF